MFDSHQSMTSMALAGGRESAPPEYFCVRRGLGLPWKRLPTAARSYVQRFVSGGLPDTYLTDDFAVQLRDRSADLAPNGPCGLAGRPRATNAHELVADLRGAFPRLVRRLVAMHSGEQVTLRLECEGTHEGRWRGLVCATRRYVTFEEHHTLTLRGSRVAGDDVAFDLASILRQLCGQ